MRCIDMNMKFKLLVWIDRNRGLYIPIFNLFLSILALKNFKFLKNLVTSDMIEAKFLIKHLLNYAIPLKTCISWGVIGTSIFAKASTFFGSMILLLNIMKPRIVFENTMNAHLFRFKLIPNSWPLRKHLLNFSRCVDRSLKIVKSSRKIFMNRSMYSQNVLVTTF